MPIFQLLESFSWVVGAAAAVTIFVAFAIIGLLLVRKVISRKALREHHDVAGFVFANIGVLYSVLLGFTVVSVQQRFDKIKEISQIEASFLYELYRDAEVFPEKDRKAIRQALKNYSENVVNEEWNSMKTGLRDEKTVRALNQIWITYYDVNPVGKKQEIWYAESISKLNQLMTARLARLIGSEESLGNEMWTLLILGGIVVVSFIWLFGVENLTAHILMAAILAATTAFLLFLIYSLDTAFSGNISIPPEALERVIRSFD